MAGAMRKMAVYLGLVEDDLGYEGDDYDDGYVEARDHRNDARDRPEVRAVPSDHRPPETRAPAVPVDPRPARPAADHTRQMAVTPPVEPYRIQTLHPRSYNDARRLGEEFREGIPVIMNLTEMGDGDAKRIVDFAAGLVFGLQGSIERVTNKVFLLSPANVDVRAEVAARLAEDGFYNQS